MSNAAKKLVSGWLAWAVIALGAAAVGVSTLNLSAAQADVRFLLLALIAVSTGTRVFLKVPHAGGHVALSDAFVLLALLLFDGWAAVLLAATAGLCVALRGRAEARALLFEALAPAASVFLSFQLLRYLFGQVTALPQSEDLFTLPLAALAVAVLHSLMLFAASAGDEGEGRGSRAEAYGWTFVTCFAVASAAGLAAKLVGVVGFYPVFAAATLATLAHAAYCAYVRDVYASAAQANEIEGHIVALEESEGMFRGAFDGAATGMAMVSADGRWLRVNEYLCHIIGYTEEELRATNFQSLAHPDDLGSVLTSVKKLMAGREQSCRMEMRCRHKDGRDVWILWNGARVAGEQGGESRLFFQVQEITDRKHAEERLLHDALHDSLTGLPNRALFMDHLKMTMARAKRRKVQIFAVLFLDVDRFKVINDSLGHMLGDQLLVGVARRLESCIRQEDTVARVGGDEFTILLEDIADEREAVSVAERIQKELTVPFSLDGHEVFTTVSIGVAPSTTGYEHPEEIMRDADTAMYRAKSLGKARHEVFDKAMHAYAVNLLQLETDLRRALERGEFFIQYQPIVSLDNFSLCGFEALVRWQHPERGLVSPLDFIPIAEDTGQIIAIGHWTLREACRQMRRWQKQFPTDLPLFISVNLSSKQFTQPDLIEQIRKILEEMKLPARTLKLEITESVVMENIEKATEMLRELRALGVQLSIDDFGTGYSSLSYLHRFPIDTLKIDRSFVMRMVDNSENIEIVRTIVMLAQILGMDVVAEGVETKEQLALLRKLGCENGQGYFFSRPLGVSGAEKIIAETCSEAQPAAAEEVSAELGPDDKVKKLRVVTAA
ncbi:MAG TPA: EAL domain-containing protein [Pyrinomonadaceae bacterium]|nr:EAL domain-containing protein [Pyrinomonadaceae bacterium]